MRKRAVLFCLLITVGCSADDDLEEMPAPTACEQLRDHLVDVTTQGAESVDKERYRGALRRSLGDDFITRCEQMPTTQRECALSAKDSTAVTACAAASTAQSL